MRRRGTEACEERVRPVDEIVIILIEFPVVEERRDGGSVLSVLRRESVTRFGGVITAPFVIEILGVPPSRVR